jgi:hypothetical protein
MAEGEAKPPTPAPQKWWQWVFIYPALATALLGALPAACQAVRAWRLDTTYAKVQLAEEQQKLWERNLDCLEAKPVYEVDVNAAVTVGVTLCPSGDALLRYAVDDELTYTWVRFPGWHHVKPQTRWDPHESVPDVTTPLASVRLAWGTMRCVRIVGSQVHRLVQRDQDDCVWEERHVQTGRRVAVLKADCDAPCPAPDSARRRWPPR